MHKLLFFSRVAFICNCSFLLGFVLRYYTFLPDSGLASTIIILGFVAPVLNFFLLVIYILMSLKSKKINHDDQKDRGYDTSGLSGPSGLKKINQDDHDYATSGSSGPSRSKKINHDDHDYDTSGSSGPSGLKKINHDDRDYDTSGPLIAFRSKHSTLIVVNFCFLGFQLISLLV